MQLEPFGVSGIRFCADGEEDELAVCCPDTRRLMDCTVDMVRGLAWLFTLPCVIVIVGMMQIQHDVTDRRPGLSFPGLNTTPQTSTRR